MLLFVNYLEGRAFVEFFNLPPKIYTWDELAHWFNSTFGQVQIPIDLVKTTIT
jgi:hypothetical protein